MTKKIFISALIFTSAIALTGCKSAPKDTRPLYEVQTTLKINEIEVAKTKTQVRENELYTFKQDDVKSADHKIEFKVYPSQQHSKYTTAVDYVISQVSPTETAVIAMPQFLVKLNEPAALELKDKATKQTMYLKTTVKLVSVQEL